MYNDRVKVNTRKVTRKSIREEKKRSIGNEGGWLKVEDEGDR